MKPLVPVSLHRVVMKSTSWAAYQTQSPRAPRAPMHSAWPACMQVMHGGSGACASCMGSVPQRLVFRGRVPHGVVPHGGVLHGRTHGPASRGSGTSSSGSSAMSGSSTGRGSSNSGSTSSGSSGSSGWYCGPEGDEEERQGQGHARPMQPRSMQPKPMQPKPMQPHARPMQNHASKHGGVQDLGMETSRQRGIQDQSRLGHGMQAEGSSMKAGALFGGVGMGQGGRMGKGVLMLKGVLLRRRGPVREGGLIGERVPMREGAQQVAKEGEQEDDEQGEGEEGEGFQWQEFNHSHSSRWESGSSKQRDMQGARSSSKQHDMQGASSSSKQHDTQGSSSLTPSKQQMVTHMVQVAVTKYLPGCTASLEPGRYNRTAITPTARAVQAVRTVSSSTANSTAGAVQAVQDVNVQVSRDVLQLYVCTKGTGRRATPKVCSRIAADVEQQYKRAFPEEATGALGVTARVGTEHGSSAPNLITLRAPMSGFGLRLWVGSRTGRGGGSRGGSSSSSRAGSRRTQSSGSGSSKGNKGAVAPSPHHHSAHPQPPQEQYTVHPEERYDAEGRSSSHPSNRAPPPSPPSPSSQKPKSGVPAATAAPPAATAAATTATTAAPAPPATAESPISISHMSGGTPNPHPCPHCARSYTTHQGLAAHLKDAHGVAPEGRRVCALCHAEFKSPAALLQHMLAAHPNDMEAVRAALAVQ